MSNQLKMAEHQAIIGLARLGWSQRRIARELGIDRETVARHVKAGCGNGLHGGGEGEPAAAAGANGAGPPVPADANAGARLSSPKSIVITGPVEGQGQPADSNAAIVITGSGEGEGGSRPLGIGADAASLSEPEPPKSVSMTVPESLAAGPAAPGRQSRCGPWRAVIVQGLGQGLTARRIWQDLKCDHGFDGDYQSVQRFVRGLKHRAGTTGLPFRRMESEAGAEAQVDFGKGAPIVTPEGKRKRPHLFRIVLSCSRKAYSEVTPRQTTEQFLRCIENAFVYFGGVPRTLVTDNLKAAVLRADWYDPELNPKIEAFARHYGTVVLPTRPRTPRHKGKIERGVGYAQSNALKGRTFASLAEQNRFLQEWEAGIADTRIHGTTRKQVGKLFEELEKPKLLPLPPGRFPCFQEAQRIVSRDGHVEVAKSYYSAPPQFVGRTVWARWDGHVVRLFDQKLQQIAIHAQREPGRFATDANHIAPEKRGGIERPTAWWLGKANAIGTHAGLWAQDVLHERGVHGVRALIGLVSLTRSHPAKTVEHACQVAQSHGARRLRDIRNLLRRAATAGAVQERFEFVTEHPLIRPLSDYSKVIHDAFDNTPVEDANGFARCPGPPPFQGDSV